MEREGRQLEYKVNLFKYDSLCKTIVAFSNDIGGKIVIGIEDKSLNVVGLEEDEIETMYEEIPKAVYDSISPYCLPDIVTKLIDNKEVLEITVRKGDRKPYFIKSEGMPKGVYIRIGAHTRRATLEIMEDLQRESMHLYWDNELTNVLPEQLEQLTLRDFYPNGKDITLLLADKIVGTKPFINEHVVTKGGVIYFHTNPSEIFPQCEILYTEFQGKTTDEIIVTKDLQGPLPVLVHKIMSLLSPHIVLREKITKTTRQAEEFIIPQTVIREVILNALVHRKYSIADAIKVAVFSDRIEVFSPGNFPGFIDTEHLGNGISYSRNPVIRHLARKAGLVEKRGMGFRIILNDSQKNGNRRPLIVEGPDFVKVTLYFERSKELAKGLPEDCRELEKLRLANTPLQTKDAKILLNTSINTARSRIQSLVELGYLEEKGKGPATKYYWRK